MSKKYNEIEVKDNMKVSVNSNEEVVVETAEKKELSQIVSVQPKKVKRTLVGRLVTGIMGPEGLPSIGTYVNEEIIKPAVKNIIYDAITSGLSRALNMDYRYNSRGGSQYPGRREAHRPATNYANYSNRYASSTREQDERKVARSSKYGVEEYLIADRHDAAHVLLSLKENADKYNVVSVADYYDLIGVDSQYTDNNYGWTFDAITLASIMPVRGGFIIKFPPVEVI